MMVCLEQACTLPPLSPLLRSSVVKRLAHRSASGAEQEGAGRIFINQRLD
jgi:hypothetical protein